MTIHSEVIKKIPFFQNQPKEFVAFIAAELKTAKFKQESFIYYEGETVDKMYFLYKGLAGFVIPTRSDGFLFYSVAEVGDMIGLVDLIPFRHA